jgi:hypothetical protein
MPVGKARQLGLNNVLPEQDVLDKAAEIGHRSLDTVFLLACRRCHSVYAGGPVTTFVIV